MAHVMHHSPLDFHPVPVNHAPSPLGFGFGLSSSGPTSSFVPAGFGCAAQPQAAHGPFQLTNQSGALAPPPARAGKRRLDPEDEGENEARHSRDVTMDRSPTPPDRARRGVPKRMRVQPQSGAPGDEKGAGGKSSGAGADDVDVGVLLAKLPPQALLPILTTLLAEHPQLKSLVLPLIPRPTLEAATQAIGAASRKLLDAYPYSQPSPLSPSASSSSATFGFGAAARPNVFSSFGASSFGSQAPAAPHAQQAMRPDYVLSRISPHVAELVTTCMTYFPYFSLAPASAAAAAGGAARERAHPSDAFTLLAAVTGHLLAQPALTQSALAPQLLPRLAAEWAAWVARVDAFVNREGGMFGAETVRAWERALDGFADAKGPGLEPLRAVRDSWVAAVGWLVNRQAGMQQ